MRAEGGGEQPAKPQRFRRLNVRRRGRELPEIKRKDVRKERMNEGKTTHQISEYQRGWWGLEGCVIKVASKERSASSTLRGSERENVHDCQTGSQILGSNLRDIDSIQYNLSR